MRLTRAALFAAAASGFVQAAQAAERQDFDIPAGRLGEALIALGRQARVTIGTGDPGMTAVRVSGLRGRYAVPQALQRLLRGTGLRGVPIDAQSFTIVREPPVVRWGLPRLRQSPAPEPMSQSEIIVTASKRPTPLTSFPATAQILDLETQAGPPAAALGTDSLVARLPTLTSTALGRGRNKLFIRGIADSSFTGPTQATVGQYLGDVRLNYNAPDPDLSLYDLVRVEVIEGPQGTLYGAGSLGGIVRLVPRMPDASEVAASISGGVTATDRGGWGHDAAGMVNLPIVADRAAFRFVGYQILESGYIDDVERGLADVNRTRILGGRGALRVTPAGGWTIDLGGLVQMIDARDSQYAERDAPPLSRRSAIAQPFDNDYALWHAVVRKHWSEMELVSATGYVRHEVGQSYDATGFPGTSGAIAFDEDNNIRLLTHETRISAEGTRGGWLVGVAVARDVDSISRRMGPDRRPQRILGIRNAVTESSLFGEGTRALGEKLRGTLGARLTYAHVTGHSLDSFEGEEFEPSRNEKRLLPTAALSWQPRQDLLAFLRYQEGFRAGGLSISQTMGEPAVRRFRPDRMRSIESGFRFGDGQRDRLSGAATVSYTSWRSIQADLILPGRLPATANIGNGRIYGVEASALWRPHPYLTASLALFLNDSGLAVSADEIGRFEIEELPNIARFGTTASLGWRAGLGRDLNLGAHTRARFVGASAIGVGPLDLSQGDYVDTSASVRLEWKTMALSVGVENLLDARANRFALGNPFSPDPDNQTTPLRPRSLRLGVEARF